MADQINGSLAAEEPINASLEVNRSVSETVWGRIAGTLTNQTDLKNALDAKQDTLTFDNAPNNGSNNPVKSGGVYSAIQDVYEVMGDNGAKNKCNPSTFVQGILNNDGTLNTGATQWITSDYIDIDSMDKVRIQGWKDGTESNFVVRLAWYDSNKTFLSIIANVNVTDNQSFSKAYDKPANAKYIRITAGFDNKTTTVYAYFATNRLMICDDRFDSTYQPPAMTNAELMDAVSLVEEYVLLSQDVTASINLVESVGKVVNVFLDISSMPDPATDDVIIGVVSKKPATTYAFCDVISKAVPFDLKTKGFIRSTTGQIVIRGGNPAIAGVTTCFIQATYVSKD